MLKYSKYGGLFTEGGNNYLAALYMLNWFGMLPAEHDTYDEYGKISPLISSPENIHVQDAIIIPKDRSVPITSTVYKTSVGTIEKVKIIKVANINNAIEKLKKYNYWIIGTDMEGEDYTTIDYKTNIALIIGNEGKGISPLVKRNCDYLAKIPMEGTVNSLNVSVACGVFLSEIVRSRK